MKTMFQGNLSIQKGNPVDAFIAGKKYSGKVKSVTKVAEFKTDVVVVLDDGTKVTAVGDNVRRTTKSMAQKNREYAAKHGLY